MTILQRNSLAVIFIACFCLAPSLTMAAASDRPDAGPASGMRQENRQPPDNNSLGFESIGQKPDNVSFDGGTPIRVAGIRITGQTIFSQDQLLPLLKDCQGQALTLGELEALAGRITNYFHEHGYLAAKAYIPVQNISGGMVEIAVDMGQSGNINSPADFGMPMSGKSSRTTQRGGYQQQDKIDQFFLLFNDRSGARVKATLNGDSGLVFDVSPTNGTGGNFPGDNLGNRFTGQRMASVGGNVNNLINSSDIFSSVGMYSGRGTSDYTLSYELPSGTHGGKMGISYARIHSAQGGTTSGANADVITTVTSIYQNYQLISSNDFNLSSRINYANSKLPVSMPSPGGGGQVSSGVWSFSLTGDSQDKFGGAATNRFSIALSSGRPGMESTAVSNDTVEENLGNNSKTSISFSRDQCITDRLNGYLCIVRQLAGNSDSSKALAVPGGSQNFSGGAGTGSRGYGLTGELHWNWPGDNFQVTAFFDSGTSILNMNSRSGSAADCRALSGTGLGFSWHRTNKYSIRLDYAWRANGASTATGADKSGSVWLQGVKYF